MTKRSGSGWIPPAITPDAAPSARHRHQGGSCRTHGPGGAADRLWAAAGQGRGPHRHRGADPGGCQGLLRGRSREPGHGGGDLECTGSCRAALGGPVPPLASAARSPCGSGGAHRGGQRRWQEHPGQGPWLPALGLPLVDLDDLIEERTGTSIPDILRLCRAKRASGIWRPATWRKPCGPLASSAWGPGPGSGRRTASWRWLPGSPASGWAESPLKAWDRVAGDPHRPLAQERATFMARWRSRIGAWSRLPMVLPLGRGPGGAGGGDAGTHGPPERGAWCP